MADVQVQGVLSLVERTAATRGALRVFRSAGLPLPVRAQDMNTVVARSGSQPEMLAVAYVKPATADLAALGEALGGLHEHVVRTIVSEGRACALVILRPDRDPLLELIRQAVVHAVFSGARWVVGVIPLRMFAGIQDLVGEPWFQASVIEVRGRAYLCWRIDAPAVRAPASAAGRTTGPGDRD